MQSFFNWSEDYCVNIREIDEQHKKIINLINELHEAMKNAKGKTILKDVFTELINYADTHFKLEENLFMKYNYEKSVEHKSSHDSLRKEIMDLKDKFEKGHATITIEVMKFLKQWLQNHILICDKQYSECFRSQGAL